MLARNITYNMAVSSSACSENDMSQFFVVKTRTFILLYNTFYETDTMLGMVRLNKI